MRDTALRRRCQRRLRDLPIPDPFDLDEFCRRLGEQRGRPLTLHQMLALGPDSPSGLWVATDRTDRVFVDEGARPLPCCSPSTPTATSAPRSTPTPPT